MASNRCTYPASRASPFVRCTYHPMYVSSVLGSVLWFTLDLGLGFKFMIATHFVFPTAEVLLAISKLRIVLLALSIGMHHQLNKIKYSISGKRNNNRCINILVAFGYIQIYFACTVTAQRIIMKLNISCCMVSYVGHYPTSIL